MSQAEARRTAQMRARRGLPNFRGSLPTDPRSWAWLTGDEPPDAAPPATRDEALSVPAFGRGVELLAATVAGVPLDAFRHTADGVDEQWADQPSVLTDPDPSLTAWNWRYGVVRDLIEAGNHVSVLDGYDFRTGRAGWLLPLPVALVGLVSYPDGRYAFTCGDRQWSPAEVLHISAGNRSGEILGQGVIAQYADNLGAQLAAEEWSGRYLRGGGLPPAVIQMQAQPTQAQADAFKTRWRALTETGEALLLPTGATITPLQSNAESQQLVQARTWNAQLSAMVLGIPAHKLNLPGTTMTYQNVQSEDVAFIRDVVTRWTDPITEALSKWLMPAGTVVKPRWAARARTDRPTQVATLAQASAAGFVTIDEARQELGYPPLPAEPAPEPPPPPAPVADELVPEEVPANV